MPQSGRARWGMIALFAFVANLPDLDFLPGFLTGNPNQFHHHFLSHSLGGSVLVGILFGGYFALRAGKPFLQYSLIFASVCFSHVVLDFFSADTSQPYGVPMFWPFSKEHIISSFPLFLSIEKSGSGFEFIWGLLRQHNLYAALVEVLIFVPVLALLALLRKRVWLFRHTGPQLEIEQGNN